MKKYLVIAVTVFVLALSSVSVQAATSIKSQLQLQQTKQSQPIMGISNGDTVETAASKLKAFLPDLILSKKTDYYEGYLEMLSNIYYVYLFSDEATRKYADMLVIMSPAISMDDLKAYSFAFFTFRTACIFQFGKPEAEVLVIDPNGPREELIPLEQENGLLPLDKFFTSKYDANINCRWNENIYLTAEKKDDSLLFEYIIKYTH